MRLVTCFPAQIKTRRQESTFLVKNIFFCDITLAKRTSIMRLAQVKAVVTCSPKTSLVSPSGDSFGPEEHCPNQNLYRHPVEAVHPELSLQSLGRETYLHFRHVLQLFPVYPSVCRDHATDATQPYYYCCSVNRV